MSALMQRRIFDAIRGAYDLGYNDARNAKAIPGDSAPGYKGRQVEADHGGALFHTLNATAQQPVAVPEGYRLVSVEQLEDWRQQANSCGAWTLKADRTRSVVKLKTAIREVMEAAPQSLNRLDLLVNVGFAEGTDPAPEAKPPSCTVGGLIYQGGMVGSGMCGAHLVGGGCGHAGKCVYKEGGAA